MIKVTRIRNNVCVAGDETSLWDHLKSAKEFAKKLADNGMTI
jgi:hypothetical protein